jgi:membrane protein DedA with SNARE-associated domain
VFEQVEQLILGTLQSIYDQFGWLGVSVMMALENATGFSSSEAVLGLAGWLLISAHELPFGMVFIGGLFAMLGSLVGASLAYWIGRLGGRPLVTRMMRWMRVSPHYLDKSEEIVHRYGSGIILVGRLVPFLRTFISMPAGMLRMNFLVFLVNTAIGAYIWCTGWIAIGYLLGHEWALVGELLKQYLPAIFFAGMLVALGMLVWQRKRAAALLLARVRR